MAVQAEGHGAGPLAGLGEDTLLLKTGRMTGVEVDVENRRVRVSAAAKWRDVSALASPEGLAPLSGSSAEVGVVGYTLGGGHGWLARKHGLACNSVLAAELVTADGKLVRADHENEPELFWALRGRRRELRRRDRAGAGAVPRARALRRHARLAVGAHGRRSPRVARVGSGPA